MGVIALFRKSVFYLKIKYVVVYYYYVRDVIAEGDIELKYIKTADNLVDVLIKFLSSEILSCDEFADEGSF